MNFSNRLSAVVPLGTNENSKSIIKLMKKGDLVIVYEGPQSLDHFYLTTSQIYQNKFGAFYHDDMIGKPFGTKIKSRSTPGWIYLLEPTPELWTTALKTRTQIVNELDSSVVIMNLDIYPGCKVLESGTGSGCMTNSLVRAIYPSGHVYSYEYNSIRATAATDEFRRLQLDQFVTVTCRDVCAEGFQIYQTASSSSSTSPSAESATTPLLPPASLDAVFLDLPQPWLALDHVFELLKPSRSICCYSPCMEQVMKTCEKLRELGFHSIRMIEVRQRPFDAKHSLIENIDLGKDLVSKTNQEFLDTLSGKFVDEWALPPPISTTTTMRTYDTDNQNNSPRKRSRVEMATADSASGIDGSGREVANQAIGNQADSRGHGEGANSEVDTGDHDDDDSAIDPRSDPDGSKTLAWQMRLAKRLANQPKPQVPSSLLVGIPAAKIKGHSAFLTFAVRPAAKPSSTAAGDV